MSENNTPVDPSIAQLTDWTNRFNEQSVLLLTPEARQLGDLAAAYTNMRSLVRNPLHEFGEETIRQFHSTLAEHVPQAGPGRYFTGPRKIMLDKSWSFTPFVEGKDKLPAIRELGIDYGRYMQPGLVSPEDSPEVVRKAAEVMTRICHIRPFFDGNGRLSRILADSIFLRAGMLQVPYWTNPELNANQRKRFLHEIIIESVKGRPNPLIRFLAHEQVQAYEDLAEALEDDPRTQGLASAGIEVQMEKELVKILTRYANNLDVS